MQLMNDGAIRAEHLISQFGFEQGEDSADEGFVVQEPVFPPHETLILYTDNVAYATARRLDELSTLAAGISGRSLCKLPWTSLVFHTDGEEVTLIKAMDALEKALHSECQAHKVSQKMQTGHSAGATIVAYG